MSRATRLQSESSGPTKIYYNGNGEGFTTQTSSDSNVVELVFQPATLPVRHKSLTDLVAHWEEHGRSEDLAVARQWVADAFYSQETNTIRTLRLRKGWSQNQLAAAIGSSQSHIARIERGTENVSITTCRKLSAALEVDLNTLDTALRAQEVARATRSE